MSTTANIAVHIVQQTNDMRKIINEFTKDLFNNKFYLNRDGLIDSADKVEFNNEAWTMNPQKFAIDHYGDIEFFQMVMMLNKIQSRYVFKRENFKGGLIIAPKRTTVLKVLAFK